MRKPIANYLAVARIDACRFGCACAGPGPDANAAELSFEVIDELGQDRRFRAGRCGESRGPGAGEDPAAVRFRSHDAAGHGAQLAPATPEQQLVLTEEFKTLLVRRIPPRCSQYAAK